MDNQQQRVLLEYYHRKDTKSLHDTEMRYQKYASSLSEICNNIRADIKCLYGYLNEAHVFVNNARIAENKSKYRLKSLDTTKSKWCEFMKGDTDSDNDSDCHIEIS